MWGVLIGLILIYLSAGYVIGGRLADRHPREEVLYQITAWAGLWIGIIPLVSYPILLISQQGFKELSVGLVAGTLLAVVVLFAAPVILLGCVSPFAIRLLLRDVETGGNTAGRVYALSTAGSILLGFWRDRGAAGCRHDPCGIRPEIAPGPGTTLASPDTGTSTWSLRDMRAPGT